MRTKKKLALMMAAAFTLMPLPSMINESISQASPSSTHVLPAHTQVSRAGVAINGVMKAAVDPIQLGGLYYVPFKQIAPILKYNDIRYNYGTKTYSATDGSVTVRVTIGGRQAMKGDEPITIHPPLFANGTTYLSLDAVSSLFNTFTYFQPENGSVQIQMPARVYRVMGTDTIWKIAQAHHTTVTAIREANGLSTDVLKRGQMLRLPSETMTKELEPSRMSTPPTPAQTAKPAQTPQVTQQTQTTYGTNLALAQAIINTGKQYMGVPYVFGSRTSAAPSQFDCSSFVQYCFAQHGISLPRDSRQQSAMGSTVTSLQPGDLLFFKYPEHYSDGRVGHVGIYMGNGQMIHTIPRTGVTITNYQRSGYWRTNFLFAKRVIH